MKNLQDDDGHIKTSTALRFLIRRLRSREQTQPRAEIVRDQLDKLDATYIAWRDIREDRMAATAEIDYRDSQEEKAVMKLSRNVLAEVEQRSSLDYRLLFPQAAPNKMLHRAEDQAQLVEGILAQSDNPAYTDYTLLFTRLNNAHQALTTAFETRKNLYIPEQQARTKLEIELDLARQIYNQTCPILQIEFPNEKSLVKSFFLR